ncbi:MAG: hypothetical protein QNJ75_01625 [Acidimicrobiia bacterium]|nr:hypothetical protein [Acidimicrobiia bacterium]
MNDFYGSVYLLDEPEGTLQAKVTVDLNRVVVTADNTEIGAWSHSEVDVRVVNERVHLRTQEETLVLEIEGQDFFLDLLGVSREEPKKGRRRRKKEPDYSGERETPFSLANFKQIALDENADPVDRRLAIVMAVAAVLILAGAVLTWGPFRLMDPGSFPIGRLLAGFGGLGAILAVYLAHFDRNRVAGSAAAIAAGVVTFCIVYLYARAARLGIGFIFVLLGSQALVTAGVLGLRQASEDTDEVDVEVEEEAAE